MIFCSITVNGIVRRISDEALSTDMLYQWKPYLLSFSNPKYTLSTKHGGRVKLDLGSIEISPDCFNYPGRDTTPPLDWPPPTTCVVDVWYSDLNDDFFGAGDHTRLFRGTAHLEKFNMERVEYSIWDEESDIQTLETGTDYDGNTIDLPRVFGRWNFHVCRRMADYSTGGNDYPTYHSGYMEYSSFIAKIIQTITDNGSGKARFTTTAAHGYSTNDYITTEDVNMYYWDRSQITVINATTFDKTSLSFVSSPTVSDYTSARLMTGNSWIQNAGHCYKDGELRVYDDGVPITGNVVTPITGRPYEFYLTVNPVGEVTCSGTGTKYGPDSTVSLKDVFDWASGSSYLNFGLVRYDPLSDNIVVSWLQDSQTRLLDFVDKLAASFHYWFYIKGTNDGRLYNMVYAATAVPTWVFREEQGKFFSIEYDYENPKKSIHTSWIKKESVEDNTGRYVKEITSETTEFSTIYDYGDEVEVDWFNQVDPATVSATLLASMALENKPKITVKVPLESPLPDIGDKIRFIDRSTIYELTTEMYVRNVTYDFSNFEVILEGDGVIYNYKDGDELSTNPAG